MNHISCDHPIICYRLPQFSKILIPFALIRSLPVDTRISARWSHSRWFAFGRRCAIQPVIAVYLACACVYERMQVHHNHSDQLRYSTCRRVRPYGLLQIRKLVFHRKMPWMKRTNIISSRSFECDDDDFASMLTADNNRINELNAIHAIASGESVCVRSFRLWSLFLCRLSLFFVVGHHFEDDNVSSVRR